MCISCPIKLVGSLRNNNSRHHEIMNKGVAWSIVAAKAPGWMTHSQQTIGVAPVAAVRGRTGVNATLHYNSEKGLQLLYMAILQPKAAERLPLHFNSIASHSYTLDMPLKSRHSNHASLPPCSFMRKLMSPSQDMLSRLFWTCCCSSYY